MFTLEMILKLTAFGFFEYLRNPYNIFDGIIVIIRSAYKIIVPIVEFEVVGRWSALPFRG